MNNLQNKVALITGGTKGIGFGIAQSLLKQGVNVAITGRTKETADNAAKELNKSGNDASNAKGKQTKERE